MARFSINLSPQLFGSSFGLGIDADLLALLVVTLELHDTVHLCIQSIVIADADILARMELSATLTNENVTRQDELTICALHAKALRMAVTAVTGGAHSLLVSEELKIHHEHVLYLRSLKIIRTLRG